MTVALGASAYAAGIFHLGTHAFFKALLFLGAGSVIIALAPRAGYAAHGWVTKIQCRCVWTIVFAAISSAGIPGFAGFFSKDSIIEATHLSTIPGAGFAYFCVLATVFITAFYTFRLMFMTFHGPERFREPPVADKGGEHGHGEHAATEHRESEHAAHEDAHTGHGHDPHESPFVVTFPLVVLAIPSVASGWVIGPVLYGGYFGNAIVVAPEHDVLGEMAREFHGLEGMMMHALTSMPFLLAIAGIATAALFYLMRPDLPAMIKRHFGLIYTILDHKSRLRRALFVPVCGRRPGGRFTGCGKAETSASSMACS